MLKIYSSAVINAYDQFIQCYNRVQQFAILARDTKTKKTPKLKTKKAPDKPAVDDGFDDPKVIRYREKLVKDLKDTLDDLDSIVKKDMRLQLKHLEYDPKEAQKILEEEFKKQWEQEALEEDQLIERLKPSHPRTDFKNIKHIDRLVGFLFTAYHVSKTQNIALGNLYQTLYSFQYTLKDCVAVLALTEDQVTKIAEDFGDSNAREDIMIYGTILVDLIDNGIRFIKQIKHKDMLFYLPIKEYYQIFLDLKKFILQAHGRRSSGKLWGIMADDSEEVFSKAWFKFSNVFKLDPVNYYNTKVLRRPFLEMVDLAEDFKKNKRYRELMVLVKKQKLINTALDARDRRLLSQMLSFPELLADNEIKIIKEALNLPITTAELANDDRFKRITAYYRELALYNNFKSFKSLNEGDLAQLKEFINEMLSVIYDAPGYKDIQLDEADHSLMLGRLKRIKYFADHFKAFSSRVKKVIPYQAYVDLFSAVKAKDEKYFEEIEVQKIGMEIIQPRRKVNWYSDPAETLKELIDEKELKKEFDSRTIRLPKPPVSVKVTFFRFDKFIADLNKINEDNDLMIVNRLGWVDIIDEQEKIDNKLREAAIKEYEEEIIKEIQSVVDNMIAQFDIFKLTVTTPKTSVPVIKDLVAVIKEARRFDKTIQDYLSIPEIMKAVKKKLRTKKDVETWFKQLYKMIKKSEFTKTAGASFEFTMPTDRKLLAHIYQLAVKRFNEMELK